MRAGLALAAGVAGAVGAWNLYQRYSTESVAYTVVAQVGDAELRRYPSVVLAETVATSEREAFGRLFRYIGGDNVAADELPMTAPVEVDGDGTSIPMTAPVERGTGVETGHVGGDEGDDSDVRMAFHLPEEYDIDSAPQPTHDEVTLTRVPERTLAVRQFSWRPTDERVARESDRLLETLEAADVPITGEPFYMGYDAPWTLPFLRRNEVAVEVEAPDQG
ncbi:SOUL family heme-binding protein [Natronoarchaeum sp. GCM10025703]|uniref:SOUL family heme-binding protein n=1 Tax=Natronoarchaeum sp. GCM10025703 TaxID=3252685 RepID=UPI00361624C7